eukprot:364857-Chlamydomonas_euryale.AAC.7
MLSAVVVIQRQEVWKLLRLEKLVTVTVTGRGSDASVPNGLPPVDTDLRHASLGWTCARGGGEAERESRVRALVCWIGQCSGI